MDNKNSAPPAYRIDPMVYPAVTTQPTMPVHAVPIRFGPDSQNLNCNYCGTPVRTSVKVEANTKTHLFAVLLCLIFCPCVCVPYCVDSCQSKNHYCPSCGNFLGAYDN